MGWCLDAKFRLANINFTCINLNLTYNKCMNFKFFSPKQKYHYKKTGLVQSNYLTVLRTSPKTVSPKQSRPNLRLRSSPSQAWMDRFWTGPDQTDRLTSLLATRSVCHLRNKSLYQRKRLPFVIYFLLRP